MIAGVRSWLDRHAIELLLTAVTVGIIAKPGPPANTTALLAALLWVPILFLLRPLASRFPGRTLRLFGAWLPFAVLLVIGVLGAANPAVSFVGATAQHTGAATWLAGFTVLAGTYYRVRAGDLGRVIRALALLGGLVALFAILESAGVPVVAREYSASSGGLLASAQELGQLLALCSGCAVAWALVGRSNVARYAGLALALLMLFACVRAGARAALVGVAAALVVTLIVRIATRRREITSAAAASIAIALIVAASAVGTILILDAPGQQARSWADATSFRAPIWATGIAKVRQEPLTGHGPEQFSVWVDYRLQGLRTLESGLTFSAHNVLLDVALALGALGLGALGFGVWVWIDAIFSTSRAAGHTRSVLSVLAGLIAWCVTLMLGWLDPLSALVASVLVACFVQGGPTAGDEPPTPQRVAVLAIVPPSIAVLLLVAAWPVLTHAYRWYSPAVSSAGIEAALAETLRSRNPLAAASVAPAISAAGVADSTLVPKALEDLEALEPLLRANAGWSVECAYAGFQLETARGMMLGEDRWNEADWYLRAGSGAEGGVSGFWDVAGAVRATMADDDPRATEFATSALLKDLPSQVRGQLIASLR